MLPAKPCTGPSQRCRLPYRSCVQIGPPSSASSSSRSRAACVWNSVPNRASPVMARMCRQASMEPGSPHISSTVGRPVFVAARV